MAIKNILSMKIPTTKTLTCILIIVLALAATNTYSTDGKRFDCQMFCRQTGYHGMIGGCRCSFTLFTSKRSLNSFSSNIQDDVSSRNEILALDSRLPRRDPSMKTKITSRLNRFAHRPSAENLYLEGRP